MNMGSPQHGNGTEISEPDMTYTKELRAATRDVHKISDVLVNAKFAFALSDDSVWADGLLSFYEIYKYLEENLPEDLLPKELHRTKQFEEDFDYFLGPNWREKYEIRPAVQNYLEHLKEVNNKSKILLFAYAYQMYMALMSGGQLLQKKRMIARKIWPNKEETINQMVETERAINPDDLTTRPMPVQVPVRYDGCAATYFPQSISTLKAKLRTILNDQYSKFDEQTKADFIEESRQVFLYNSEVVRSVKGVNRANAKKLAIVIIFFVGLYLAVKLVRH